MGFERAGERSSAQAANLRGLAPKAEISLHRSGSLSMRAASAGRHPFALALALFLPLVGDLVDLKREHQHLARHFLAGRQRLGVEIAAGFAARDGAGQAGFLAGFAGGGLTKLLGAFRPALGQDPAAGVAAGDEHDLDAVVGLAPRQRGDLQAAGRLAEKPAHPFHQMVARQHIHEFQMGNAQAPIRLPP